MIAPFLLVPSLFNISENRENNVQIVKDFLLLMLVITLKQIFKINAPYTIFVYMGFYYLSCEIINDLSYKLLNKNIKLRQEWLSLQKSQVQEKIIEYIKLKYDNGRL